MTMRAIPLLCLALLALAAGCATSNGAGHAYKLYPGPERPVAELATLDIAGVDSITVDKLQVKRWDYGTVLLLPGKHTVVMGKGFAFSVMVEPAMHGEFERSLEVDLAPGKVYKVMGDRTHGHGYRVYLWIEDAENGEVVAGEKKP